MDNLFDFVVIGGGPGGYPAAIRAAQNGMKVALIEAKELGGTCLNRGCIPTKTLIASARALKQVKEAEIFGVVTGEVSFDYKKMLDRKEKVVSKIRKGLEGLVHSNKITVFKGFGSFISPYEIKVVGPQETVIRGKKIVIATGSEPKVIPAFKVDGIHIHDSTTLLNHPSLPKKIIIIGGGVIGCEFASLFKGLGTEVAIIEKMPSLIPLEAKTVSQTLTRAFQRQGIQIITDASVEKIDKKGEGVEVKLASGETIEGDIALIAIGRSMNTHQIGLEKAGVNVAESGLIPTTPFMETNVSGIYAVGDISSKYWLAHVASHQGMIAADHASGIPHEMNYDVIPSVMFTSPEIGTVGLSLEDALKKGFHAALSTFPYQALGKAQAEEQLEGFGEIVYDKTTGQILGAQVVGQTASNLIAEMALAIRHELTIESLVETIHPHPTIAEVWLEAALQATDKPLHIPPKKRHGTP